VRADRSQLEQVLVNLAVNARDAMPGGGSLTVSTAAVELRPGETHLPPGPYVRLTVCDNGCGMDEVTRERAFEPFFTTKPQDKGTGLGLATVYAIVQQSGGRIHADSVPLHGTTFTIDLPRHDGPRPAPRTPPTTTATPRGVETLLLVEDEDSVRSLVKTVLTGAGYRVLEACHGREGLRLAEETRDTIHLVLTDVVMPEMSGRELMQRLSELRPGVKCLYMSGYTDDALIRQGLRTDGLNFLHKPFTPAELSRRVRDVLEKS
jgi:CheY-like chemotaxis protein